MTGLKSFWWDLSAPDTVPTMQFLSSKQYHRAVTVGRARQLLPVVTPAGIVWCVWTLASRTRVRLSQPFSSRPSATADAAPLTDPVTVPRRELSVGTSHCELLGTGNVRSVSGRM